MTWSYRHGPWSHHTHSLNFGDIYYTFAMLVGLWLNSLQSPCVLGPWDVPSLCSCSVIHGIIPPCGQDSLGLPTGHIYDMSHDSRAYDIGPFLLSTTAEVKNKLLFLQHLTGQALAPIYTAYFVSFCPIDNEEWQLTSPRKSLQAPRAPADE